MLQDMPCGPPGSHRGEGGDSVRIFSQDLACRIGYATEGCDKEHVTWPGRNHCVLSLRWHVDEVLSSIGIEGGVS